MPIYYRPEWTCGRYDKNSHSAIYYNLIEGMAYSFTDYSADVIGYVLAAGRNGKIEDNEIARLTGISIDSIVDFFRNLQDVNLLSTQLPQKAELYKYRNGVSNARKKQRAMPMTIKERVAIEMAEAEKDYSTRAGGITGVMLELTYRCSEKCIHCYNPGATRNDEEKSHRGDREELTLNDYKRIIDELYDEGIIKVCLSGGDPFSNKYVWDIIQYLYDKDIAFDIYTNGQSIGQQIERLAESYPRLIGISIYSGNPEEHDRITRIPGSWLKSMDVVKGLSALAVPMNLKCCVMKPNLKHYYEVVNIACENGAVPQIEICVNDSVDGDKCVSKYLRLDEKQYEMVLRDPNCPLYVGRELENYGGRKRPMDSYPCGAARSSFCVTPEGNLIPCCSFHLVFGNLKESHVKDLLHNSDMLHVLCNSNLCDYEECGQHEYCDYCNLCPGINFSQYGDFKKAGENNCYLAKIRYTLAKKMMKENYDPLDGDTLAVALSKLKTEKVDNLHRIH